MRHCDIRIQETEKLIRHTGLPRRTCRTRTCLADRPRLVSCWAPARQGRARQYAHSQNAVERALCFVESGVLEVTSIVGGLSVRSIDWFHPVSVVGELSFLDGKPRSAEVSAIVDSELYGLDFQAYEGSPARSRASLLSCVLATHAVERRTVARRLTHGRTKGAIRPKATHRSCSVTPASTIREASRAATIVAG